MWLQPILLEEKIKLNQKSKYIIKKKQKKIINPGMLSLL